MPLSAQASFGRPFLSSKPEFLRDLGFPAKTRLTSRWLRVRDLMMHSRTSDRTGAVPFLLIHGLVISSLYMIPLAECLAVDHPVHALDLPGFGRSEGGNEVLAIPELAEVVLQWMSACEIDQCHVVANSLGCQIATHMAVKAPHRLVTVTLIGATIDPEARQLGTQILRLLWDAWHEPARLWANWIFDLGRTGLRRAIRTTGLMFQDRIEERLPRITAPTLMIRGERDPTMPGRWGEQATRLLPRGRLVSIRDHAHCVHYSDPLAVAGAIIEHTRMDLSA